MDKLIDKIKETNNPTVIGLDPRYEMIPECIRNKYEENLEGVAKAIVEFNKALRLLDCGKIERAVEILQTVINNAQNEEDDLLFIQSNCVLGELYFDCDDFDKSKSYLETALNRMNDSGLDEDLFDYEKSTALKILSKLNNNY